MLTIPKLNPSRVYLNTSEEQLDIVRDLLTYKDRSAEFQYRKFKHATWYADKYGTEAFQSELDRRKEAIDNCILFEDDKGFYTYSGLVNFLKARFPNEEVVDQVEYPSPEALPWRIKPTVDLWQHQKEAIELMLVNKHCAVEMATGLGKSRIIQELVRKLGLKTVIMAPLGNIAEQLYRELIQLFGEKYVGFYGDGKKHFKKLITVGIHASLTRIDKESPDWEALSQAKVFIADESHMTPAASLKNVCMGLCATAPYRFFFSATQMRGDGAELVLKGITGPIVYTMTFEEGVKQGYLARPHFNMIKVPSLSTKESKDAVEMTREHLYYNPLVAKKAAQIANSAVKNLGHQVLILVQEVEQFSLLLPMLNYMVGFAHGGLTKTNKDKVPVIYHDSDPAELVKQFNDGSLAILVGTSCVATGVDIKSANTVIYLMGLASEIKVKQAVGRGTRTPAGKTEFYFFDFCPVLTRDIGVSAYNGSPPYRHAFDRLNFYKELYDDVKVI